MFLTSLLQDGIQILILAVAIYYLLAFFRGTRAFQTLLGLVVVLAGMRLATNLIHMNELGWLLNALMPALPIALIVVFHPELRRALAVIGEHTGSSAAASESTVTAVVRAVDELSKQRIGALIAIERSASLRQYQQHGRELNAPLIWELLTTLFYPHTPTHDGGVIIHGTTIVAAGCVFPLSTGRADLRSYGTRHRAAVGLSEETDALVIVVSEETGLISVAYRGRLTRGLDVVGLRDILTKTLVAEKDDSQRSWKRRPVATAAADAAPDELEEEVDQVAEAIAAVEEERE